MKGLSDRFGLEVLDEDECFHLLRSKTVGRLAVVSGEVPIVLPVNYAVDGRSVVLRTAPGTKLAAARRGAVCLEVDETDDEHRIGWSVLLHGRAEPITDLADVDRRRLCDVQLHPWAGEKPIWVRIKPNVVSGRRLAVGARLRPAGQPPPLPSDAGLLLRTDDVGLPIDCAVIRTDDRRARLRGRRGATLAMVDADGNRIAVVSFDGLLTSPEVDVTIIVDPAREGPGITAAALLVNRLAVVAGMEGATRLVVDYDPRGGLIHSVLDATGRSWVTAETRDTARAEVALRAEHGAGCATGAPA